MLFEIGIEDNVEGRSLAWALENPGCFAYAEDGEKALIAMPRAIMDYAAWIESRNAGESWLDTSEIELYLAGSWEVYAIDEDYNLAEQGYEVNAWFRHDWKPLSEADVERGLKLLDWSRADLLDAVSGLSRGALKAERHGERWSIAGILKHVGGAEWWYLDRLGLAFLSDDLPSDPFERLQVVRAHTIKVLPTLVGSRQVVGVEGEFWSPRKALRRAAWHERDHTQHIRKLVQR